MEHLSGKTGFFQFLSHVFCYIFGTAKRTATDQGNVRHDALTREKEAIVRCE
jgi:hypothetical protein